MNSAAAATAQQSHVLTHMLIGPVAGIQTVLDALRARKDRFMFEGGEIALQSSVMAFITMNPGYPGRAELPESLKVGQLICNCQYVFA